MLDLSPLLLTNISTDTTILTTGGVFYGFAIIPATTAACKAVAYDAKATATGVCVFVSSVASTAGLGNNLFIIQRGVRCGTGIHIDVTCTTGSDQVIVYYGKLS